MRARIGAKSWKRSTCLPQTAVASLCGAALPARSSGARLPTYSAPETRHYASLATPAAESPDSCWTPVESEASFSTERNRTAFQQNVATPRATPEPVRYRPRAVPANSRRALPPTRGQARHSPASVDQCEIPTSVPRITLPRSRSGCADQQPSAMSRAPSPMTTRRTRR